MDLILMYLFASDKFVSPCSIISFGSYRVFPLLWFRMSYVRYLPCLAFPLAFCAIASPALTSNHKRKATKQLYPRA